MKIIDEKLSFSKYQKKKTQTIFVLELKPINSES